MKKIKKTFYPETNKIASEWHLLNNKYHREDGPAKIWYYKKYGKIECLQYYINGKLHREDGPARIWCDRYGKITKEDYWINGKEITDGFQIMVIRGLGMK